MWKKQVKISKTQCNLKQRVVETERDKLVEITRVTILESVVSVRTPPRCLNTKQVYEPHPGEGSENVG